MLYSREMSALAGLRCPECGREHEADRLQSVCQACDSPLLACYDLDRVRASVSRADLAKRPPGIWRWAELLPVRSPACRVTLGEGETPLLRADRLGARLGLGALLVKDEGLNPTGTFKARGLAVAVARAAELGAKVLAMGTAGNAGGALAAYAARAGLEAHVFMPADAPAVHRREVEAAGARLHLVDGLLDRAGEEAARRAGRSGWFVVSTFREPYRLEGKKTMGFEMAERMGWELPDVIVYPTGGGTGLVGLWKAFAELETLGWLEGRRPRLVCVQAEGCAPVVRALDRGEARVEPWGAPKTAAHGLRVPRPYADRLILRAVRESGGVGACVSDEEMVQAQRELAREEGILACLEGAAALAGLTRLVRAGQVEAGARVVVLNTGSGLKGL